MSCHKIDCDWKNYVANRAGLMKMSKLQNREKENEANLKHSIINKINHLGGAFFKYFHCHLEHVIILNYSLPGTVLVGIDGKTYEREL
jgi:hypothetical protein